MPLSFSCTLSGVIHSPESIGCHAFFFGCELVDSSSFVASSSGACDSDSAEFVESDKGCGCDGADADSPFVVLCDCDSAGAAGDGAGADFDATAEDDLLARPLVFGLGGPPPKRTRKVTFGRLSVSGCAEFWEFANFKRSAKLSAGAGERADDDCGAAAADTPHAADGCGGADCVVEVETSTFAGALIAAKGLFCVTGTLVVLGGEDF